MFHLDNTHYEPDSQSVDLLSGSKHVAQDIIVHEIVWRHPFFLQYNCFYYLIWWDFYDIILHASAAYMGTIILRTNGAQFCTDTDLWYSSNVHDYRVIMALLYLNIGIDKKIEGSKDKMLWSVTWCILKTYLDGVAVQSLLALVGGGGTHTHTHN
jgi:hypothetical protein